MCMHHGPRLARHGVLQEGKRWEIRRGRFHVAAVGVMGADRLFCRKATLDEDARTYLATRRRWRQAGHRTGVFTALQRDGTRGLGA